LGFGNPDLCLTVLQVSVELAVFNGLAIGIEPEDVADFGAVLER